jgi:hypothetical protein
MLILMPGLFFGARTTTTFPALPVGWQICQPVFELISSAPDGFLI